MTEITTIIGAPVWICKACAEAYGLSWKDGGSSADGGWCGVGRHPVPRGERIEYLADWTPVVAAVPVAMPVDDSGQMGLLL
jgi:hypothetical protein